MSTENNQAIEVLKFKVSPELQEEFIKIDHRIWTPALAKWDGFLSKEIWADPEQPDILRLVIHWQSKAHWAAIPTDFLEQVDKEFAAAYPHPFEMVGEEYRLIDVE